MSDDYNGLALKAISFGKDLYKKSKNVVLKVSEIEAKVKEATNSEAWGPSGTLLNEISALTTDDQQKAIILSTLWERLREPPQNWRKVYKALNVIEYCVKNGSRRFVEDVRDNVDRIEDCKRFKFVEADTGKDQGLNIREKCKALAELLQNTEKLAEEREKARRARDRFHNQGFGGVSNDDFRGGASGSTGRWDRDEDWDALPKKKGGKDDDDDWDGPKKKTSIDDWDRPSRNRAGEMDDPPRRSGGGGGGGVGRSAKVEDDDDWDAVRPRQTAASSRADRAKSQDDNWGDSPEKQSSIGPITMNIKTQVSANSSKKTNVSARPITAAAVAAETNLHKSAAQVAATAPAVDLLGLDTSDAVGPSHKEGDEWSAFESFGGLAVGRGVATNAAAGHPAEQLANILVSGPAFGPPATPDFGGFGGDFGFGSTPPTQNPGVGNFATNTGAGGSGFSDGFGGLGLNNSGGQASSGGQATSFPVSFNSGSSSDLFGDFGSGNGSSAATTSQEQTAPAKAAVSALVNLDNLKISAKEAQAAAAAAAAAPAVKSGPMKALASSTKPNAQVGSAGVGSSIGSGIVSGPGGLQTGGFGFGGMGGMSGGMGGGMGVSVMSGQMGGNGMGSQMGGVGMGSQMGGMGMTQMGGMGGMGMGGLVGMQMSSMGGMGGMGTGMQSGMGMGGQMGTQMGNMGMSPNQGFSGANGMGGMSTGGMGGMNTMGMPAGFSGQGYMGMGPGGNGMITNNTGQGIRSANPFM